MKPLPRAPTRARGTRKARPVRKHAASSRASAPRPARTTTVDRLVRDPHARIIGEVDLQPGRDLLRAPRPRPAAVLATRLVAALPRLYPWPPNPGPLAAPDVAGEAVPHALPQSPGGRRLGRLWG